MTSWYDYDYSRDSSFKELIERGMQYVGGCSTAELADYLNVSYGIVYGWLGGAGYGASASDKHLGGSAIKRTYWGELQEKLDIGYKELETAEKAKQQARWRDQDARRKKRHKN